MRWEPDRARPTPPDPRQVSVWVALGRGLRGRCPTCGEGHVFAGYLALAPQCEACGTAFGHLRADDAPPYFTILLVGHLLVPGVLVIEKTYEPPMWVHMAVWLPFFTLASLAVLRPVKGAVVAWMLRLGVTGNEQGGLPEEQLRPAPIPLRHPSWRPRGDGNA